LSIDADTSNVRADSRFFCRTGLEHGCGASALGRNKYQRDIFLDCRLSATNLAVDAPETGEIFVNRHF
jgi:hypothetical protein